MLVFAALALGWRFLSWSFIVNSMTISMLEAFPAQLQKYFLAIPEEYWSWSPASWEGIPSEKLNALEHICHIKDIEIDGYHVRFQRLLEERNPVLASIDGYALIKERHYASADPDEIFTKIKTAREETIRLVRSLTPEQLARSGSFEGYGQLSVEALIHYLCSHDLQHLSGLQWLLGRIRSQALGSIS